MLLFRVKHLGKHAWTHTQIAGYSCPKQTGVKPLGRFSHTSNIKDSLQPFSVTLSVSLKLHESCCLVTEAVCVLHGNISRLVIIMKDLISILLISARGGVIGVILVWCTPLCSVHYTYSAFHVLSRYFTFNFTSLEQKHTPYIWCIFSFHRGYLLQPVSSINFTKVSLSNPANSLQQNLLGFNGAAEHDPGSAAQKETKANVMREQANASLVLLSFLR